MKRVLQKIYESSSLIRRILQVFRNQFKIGKNKCEAQSIHFKENKILLSGSENKIICSGSSFLRRCIVRMDGNNNNFLMGSESTAYGENGQTIFVVGRGNRIVIGKNCTLRKVSFFIRGNNKITLEDNCSAYAVQFHIEQDGNEICIGEGTTLHGRNEHSIHIAADEGSRIVFGKDCMLSNGIQIHSTDSHSIVDMDGCRINPAKDVVIGDHCWLGLQSVVLKGTVVGAHCVVGAGAVCNRNYAVSNCVLAGNPAKIVKTKIDWDRKYV